MWRSWPGGAVENPPEAGHVMSLDEQGYIGARIVRFLAGDAG